MAAIEEFYPEEPLLPPAGPIPLRRQIRSTILRGTGEEVPIIAHRGRIPFLDYMQDAQTLTEEIPISMSSSSMH